MNLMNRMMISESNPKLNINGTVKGCKCEECTNVRVENQIVEYPSLTEEEIEQIIKERYDSKDKKTKTFIRKALRKHGDRYDYSKVDYVNLDKKVLIICPKHDVFPQTPHNHLRGYNCRKCFDEKQAYERKMTLEKFIKESNYVHGEGTYDYSKVVYINTYTEVTIICPKHGDFLQRPNNHLQGQGCKKCQYDKLSQLNRMLLEEFIEKANKVHGEGTYDYSKVNYINANTKIIIICPKHGKFKQMPYAHLQGQGCSKCNSSKGEIIVRKFLIENKIEFEEQKQFDDCRNKLPLRFDFYIPQYNLCIEYDGEQHFNPSAFNSRKVSEDVKLKNLKLIQHRDEIKNEYCKNKGINLLRIKYNENAENKLIEYFF